MRQMIRRFDVKSEELKNTIKKLDIEGLAKTLNNLPAPEKTKVQQSVTKILSCTGSYFPTWVRST